ncbi:hypothetical protein SDC9_163296 [bioreactor metagenome]|uniref:Uncharacterized protein n=1 Tax=bioreactor metagenome TaxID=1076179 RepID=A0A645FPQ2_9ZZZZ
MPAPGLGLTADKVVAVRLPVLAAVMVRLAPAGTRRPAAPLPLVNVFVPLRVRFTVAPDISKAQAEVVPLTSIFTLLRVILAAAPEATEIRSEVGVPLMV